MWSVFMEFYTLCSLEEILAFVDSVQVTVNGNVNSMAAIWKCTWTVNLFHSLWTCRNKQARGSFTQTHNYTHCTSCNRAHHHGNPAYITGKSAGVKWQRCRIFPTSSHNLLKHVWGQMRVILCVSIFMCSMHVCARTEVWYIDYVIFSYVGSATHNVCMHIQYIFKNLCIQINVIHAFHKHVYM